MKLPFGRSPFGGGAGFLLALLVIVVVSKLTPEPSKEVTDDFDTYMELDV